MSANYSDGYSDGYGDGYEAATTRDSPLAADINAELLQACRKMLEAIDRHYPHDWSGLKSQAHAAIANAEDIPRLPHADGDPDDAKAGY